MNDYRRRAITPTEDSSCVDVPLPHRVVHDLMQPLSALSFIVEDLEDIFLRRDSNTNSDDAHGPLLQQLKRAVANEERLLMTLRSYIRLHGKYSGVKLRPVQLSELLDGLVLGFRGRYPELEFEFGNMANTWVLSDPIFLQDILFEFLQNAATHANEKIHISVRPIPGPYHFICIDVCDDGPGLPPAADERLGMPFFRNAQYQKRKTAGLGLGIHLAASMAKELGHHLSVTHHVPNGCVFSLIARIAEPSFEAISLNQQNHRATAAQRPRSFVVAMSEASLGLSICKFLHDIGYHAEMSPSSFPSDVVALLRGNSSSILITDSSHIELISSEWLRMQGDCEKCILGVLAIEYEDQRELPKVCNISEKIVVKYLRHPFSPTRLRAIIDGFCR